MYLLTSVPYPFSTFSRSPTSGYKLPSSSKSGSCVVFLDMQVGEEDQVVMWEVAAVAMGITNLCVGGRGRGGGLGGWGWAGGRRVLEVTVFGGIGGGAGREGRGGEGRG